MIKKTILSIFICLYSLVSFGSCSWEGLYAWPKGKTISCKPVIVVDGYAGSQEIILKLNNSYTVYLLSGSNRIALTVRETHKGDHDLTQALLVPATTLIAGNTYTLCIDSISESLSRWNDDLNKHEPITWTAIAETDTLKPIWLSKPAETGKSYTPYGCGPAIYVNFACAVSDSSECLAETTLINTRTGKTTVYYIPVENGSLNIGHGMCSGAFRFGKQKHYQVSFVLMDASGNKTPWTGRKIAFTRPTYKPVY